MPECKECTCEMKYINNLFNNNMKNTKNILCKKNITNLKFMVPFELMFYLTSFTSVTLYSYYSINNRNSINN
jgi:hypothetical protein